jgi:EAL domain-containing protein (putative c-di-GMP-specific phosphodiesterase class I)
MAHALSLEVVAEGVERLQQREYLADHHCDQIQGWLVARPMDAATFESWWLRQHKATPAPITTPPAAEEAAVPVAAQV